MKLNSIPNNYKKNILKIYEKKYGMKKHVINKNIIKKYILYLLMIFMCIMFVIYKCNNIENKINSDKKEESIKQEIEEEKINIKSGEVIRVKMHETGDIVAMDLNDYLCGVVPAEMSPTYNIEALKAQAIVARTYTYRKMNEKVEGEDADICDNYAHCQAYLAEDKLCNIWKEKGYSVSDISNFLKKVREAVVLTNGLVITYNNEIISAYFHASSPCGTENVDQIWGKKYYPYLVSVESKEDENYINRTSVVELPFSKIREVINESGKYGYIDLAKIQEIKITEYTSSKRVKTVKINNVFVPAEDMRTLFNLKSTNFKIEINEQIVKFNVIGYGHGIGMSQVGANTYANEGLNYEEIIKHYYTGVKIDKYIK